MLYREQRTFGIQNIRVKLMWSDLVPHALHTCEIHTLIRVYHAAYKGATSLIVHNLFDTPQKTFWFQCAHIWRMCAQPANPVHSKSKHIIPFIVLLMMMMMMVLLFGSAPSHIYSTFTYVLNACIIHMTRCYTAQVQTHISVHRIVDLRKGLY